MPFQPLITAVMETALNTFIQDDPELGRRLARLKGQVIQVHIKELNQTFTFVFSQQIDVLAQYEGEADCYLSVHLSVLPELREQANITQLIKQDRLMVQGDIQLAQKFAQLIQDCQPDLEEWLSRVTGDVVAHTVVQGAKKMGRLVNDCVNRQQHHWAQILTEEWRIAPPPLEVAYFCDQVDDVTSQAARVEARLNRLLEKI
ncbi:ubiquinone biosynthesis accessory factor UbiJ [Vibrio cincinnatiensis]|jgi:ubiquinone biosynthesis protein UbiJ|uniref:Ubiquinone biosynthesis accessory factor UbiJ n=1 Tax=Vibrio cincinnatiensis DSM 19608 TaxID=1123491 RepID=A0A1T4R618_VIBCI|nr:SCP2 domain-containing protein [Vibrio cincinnatiensis]MCG3722334.1 SCP2 domain-containing protein [Vibrio cincinnatiensis]MCG3732994.1 SCP2 domain-containing protein [Vibrio cincinnatiensis]MCG3740319.1 SCP2 domain-containing protein [Vibrio cincinnatiensis]MCG3744212.1 SCP2 domain-containing protein [Vibrio cincinnatiensis]MCG3758174.1 SCP2 domain-containing protein [Vibrio cincinnatiensis]